jgi:hypothetical protein
MDDELAWCDALDMASPAEQVTGQLTALALFAGELIGWRCARVPLRWSCRS